MLEKLRDASELLLAHFPLLAGITLVFSLPANLVQNFLIESAGSPREMLFLALISGIFYLGLLSLCMGALLQALGRICLGDRIPFGTAFIHALESWPRLLWSWMLALLFILAGLFVFILPGLYLAIKYMFVPHVAVLEELGGHAGRRRSWHLSDGHGWTILGIYAIVALPLLAAEALFLLFGAPFSESPLGLSIMGVVFDLVLLWPFTAVFLVFWEARARDEKIERLPEDLLKLERDFLLDRQPLETRA